MIFVIRLMKRILFIVLVAEKAGGNDEPAFSVFIAKKSRLLNI